MTRYRVGIVRAGVVGTTAAAMALTGLAGAAAVHASPAPSLDWQPCAENAEVQCASLAVPIDYAHPEADQIELAVARRPATNPDQRIGSLVYLPGGPGGSGVGALLSGAPFPPEVAARFDLVSFDPRGTNRSHPVLCDGALLDSPPNVVPETGGTLAEIEAFSRKLGDSCREHTGPLIDHVDSVSVARDIDAFRAALGEEKISLYGISYGTLTGQMYAENFPSRIRALVLDSVFDHSLGAGRFFDTEARAGEDAFAEFAGWCAVNQQCALHGRDVGRVFDDLYARALKGELHAPGDPTAPLAPMELVSGTIGMFYGPDWPRAAETLKALADQAPPASVRATAEPRPFPVASFCGDHRLGFSSEREWTKAWQRQNHFAPHLRTHFAWQVASFCFGWSGETGNPQHRLDIKGAPPILLLNALHDPATGYEWAANVARQIDHSRLLTYDGWGHGVMGRSECTTGAVDRYLVDLTTPRPGTHCPAVPPDAANRSAAGAPAAPWSVG
jgi:pimeloyl-ACP methyl ester carboxylesterase